MGIADFAEFFVAVIDADVSGAGLVGFFSQGSGELASLNGGIDDQVLVLLNVDADADSQFSQLL